MKLYNRLIDRLRPQSCETSVQVKYLPRMQEDPGSILSTEKSGMVVHTCISNFEKQSEKDLMIKVILRYTDSSIPILGRDLFSKNIFANVRIFLLHAFIIFRTTTLNADVLLKSFSSRDEKSQNLCIAQETFRNSSNYEVYVQIILKH